MLKGIDLTYLLDLYNCTYKACLYSRMHDIIYRDSLVNHDTKPYKVIFSNIKGPIKVAGYNGLRYFITF